MECAIKLISDQAYAKIFIDTMQIVFLSWICPKLKIRFDPYLCEPAACACAF